MPDILVHSPLPRRFRIQPLPNLTPTRLLRNHPIDLAPFNFPSSTTSNRNQWYLTPLFHRHANPLPHSTNPNRTPTEKPQTCFLDLTPHYKRCYGGHEYEFWYGPPPLPKKTNSTLP